ncbi:MAG: PAS domain S-box protein, partial [Leptolyngbyaceae cyanobacterium bins.59]|nr:PAS domain S-box protein [Leptolyngbyaceae cyanobacterium bins.59]
MTKLAKYYLARLQRSDLQLQEEVQNRQKLEARLQTITDQIPGALYTYVLQADGSDYMEYMSEGFQELTEISATAVMADIGVFHERFHPDDRDQFWQIVEESASTLNPVYAEWRFILPSGEVKWLAARSRPTRQSDGSTVWQGILTDISDRKQAELALQESETINRALLEAIPDLLIRMQRDGTYLMVQSTGNVTLFNPTQTHAGKNIFDILPVERATERMVYVQTALATRTLQVYEYQLDIDGVIHYEEARIVPCGVNEVLVMVREISDRKRAEEQLRAEHEFRMAIEQAIVEGLIVIDNHGRQSYVNPAFCEMVGWSAQELLGKKAPFVYWNPEELEGKVESLIQCQPENRNNASRGMELQFQRRNGEKFDVLLLDSLVRDSNGKVIAWLASVYDITERKRTEAALRESADRERMLNTVMQQVRQSLDLNTIFQATTRELRRMLECDRVVIYQFKQDWSGIFVAESVREGWTSLIEEFSQGEEALEVQGTSDDRCILRAWDQHSIDTIDTYLKETEGGLYRHGIPFISVPDIHRANFSPCYLELLQRFQARAYLTVPLYSGNRLWGLLASYHNAQPRIWRESEIQIACQIGTQLGVALQQAELFAQLKQQSEELRQARDVAEAANRAKSAFLANMSHELRTPLNAILGFTELLSYDSTLLPEHQENIRIVHRNGGHLLNLINDILDLSKIEAGRIEVNATSFNLPEMAQSLCLTFKQRATTKGLQLNLEIDPGVPRFITTDSQKLRQILMNLLGNALKFTQNGSVKLHIQVKEGFPLLASPTAPVPSPETLLLQFAIEDTGVGIASEEQTLIFEAFNQAQNCSVPADGTGLGLTISRQFAHLLGGDITVHSTLGV